MKDYFTEAERKEWIRQWEVTRTKLQEILKDYPNEIWLCAYSDNTAEKLGGKPNGEWN